MVHRSRSVSSHQRKVVRQRARRMRHEPSRGEWVLWQALRCSQLGVAFRRQVVLQGYIADYYACVAQLIVEVDGGWHALAPPTLPWQRGQESGILTWVGFTPVVRTWAAMTFAALGAAILTAWATLRHRAYRRDFDGKEGRPLYPAQRRALLPFVY